MGGAGGAGDAGAECHRTTPDELSERTADGSSTPGQELPLVRLAAADVVPGRSCCPLKPSARQPVGGPPVRPDRARRPSWLTMTSRSVRPHSRRAEPRRQREASTVAKRARQRGEHNDRCADVARRSWRPQTMFSHSTGGFQASPREQRIIQTLRFSCEIAECDIVVKIFIKTIPGPGSTGGGRARLTRIAGSEKLARLGRRASMVRG